MPEISVIMPVYNKETYFEAAIRSVLNQPFADLELIVVNDGSTDGSLALAQKIAEEDQRVCLIDIPNGGETADGFAVNVYHAECGKQDIRLLLPKDLHQETGSSSPLPRKDPYFWL